MARRRERNPARLGGYLLLLLAVNVFLLGSEDLHALHTLSEIAFHSRQAAGAEGYQQPFPASHSHKCHSCLVAHPGASASTSLPQQLVLPAAPSTLLNLEQLLPQTSRLFTGIHKRAPPC